MNHTKPKTEKTLMQPGFRPRFEWYLKDENGKAICTFLPKVVGVVETESSKDVKTFIRLKLHFKNGDMHECKVSLSRLEKIDWFELDERCLVNTQNRNAQKYIANYIRAAIVAAPREKQYTFDRLGLYRIGDTILFAAGNRLIQSSNKRPELNVELTKLSFRLDIDLDLTKRETFEGLRQLICLSPEIGRVLVAHVISGITRTAFKEAGFIPCAVLIVVGESGMLKSHYVPHLAQLYNRADEIRSVTRFNSTHRFIEDVLYEYCDCTAVIDDLHTAESRSIKKSNETAAEEILRRISDDTGRGHKEGSSLVQKKFRGNAVFIGEYVIGKASTIPRALVIHLTRRPDGKILDEYQRKKPLLVSTFYYYFIQWYVDHFDDIRDGIDAKLTAFRAKNVNSQLHGRLHDTQFYLQVSYMIFLEFCKDAGFISPEDAQNEYRDFDSQLVKLIQDQQNRFELDRRKTDGVDYLQHIRKLYKARRFRLADSERAYNPNKHDGLIYYECLCVRRHNLERLLRETYGDVQISDVIKCLKNQQALKLVKDKYTVKISTLNKTVGAIRFYAIKLDKLK